MIVRAWLAAIVVGALTANVAAHAHVASQDVAPQLVAPPPVAPSTSAELFKHAIALQNAGDFEGAAAAYRQFLAEHADNIEARSNLGVVLVRLGRYSDAVDVYRQALSRDPSRTAVRVNLGIALYKAHQLSDAARELDTVLEAQPDNLQARYLTADCRLRLGEPAKTVGLLAPLESSRPDDLALAYLLGMGYLRTEQVDKGQALIDRILRKGDSAEARLMMGVARLEMNDFKSAIEDLKRAAELNPELPTVHGLYAQALLETGNRDLARREFEAELARNPLDFQANLYFGVLLKEDQQFDDAMKHLSVALRVRPGELATRYQIASLKLAARETEAALPLLEDLVKEAPSFLEAHVSLATAYYRLKRREDGDRERAIVDQLNRELQARQTKIKVP
jgi:tetratricopeptide (TPR) repeat protein